MINRNAFIVTELMDVNLYQFLQHKNLSFEHKLKIATDIAAAMEYLHSRCIIHRDLKSVNVLLNIHGPDIIVKVGGHSFLPLHALIFATRYAILD